MQRANLIRDGRPSERLYIYEGKTNERRAATYMRESVIITERVLCQRAMISHIIFAVTPRHNFCAYLASIMYGSVISEAILSGVRELIGIGKGFIIIAGYIRV